MKNEPITGTEIVIGWVLKVGVAVSLAIILLGMVLFYIQNAGMTTVSYYSFVTTSAFPHDVSSLLASVWAGRGVGFIMLGIMLLVMTPVVRVAVSAVAFIRQRDIPMSLVTVFVFAVLVASFYIGILTR